MPINVTVTNSVQCYYLHYQLFFIIKLLCNNQKICHENIHCIVGIIVMLIACAQPGRKIVKYQNFLYFVEIGRNTQTYAVPRLGMNGPDTRYLYRLLGLDKLSA